MNVSLVAAFNSFVRANASQQSRANNNQGEFRACCARGNRVAASAAKFPRRQARTASCFTIIRRRLDAVFAFISLLPGRRRPPCKASYTEQKLHTTANLAEQELLHSWPFATKQADIRTDKQTCERRKRLQLGAAIYQMLMLSF